MALHISPIDRETAELLRHSAELKMNSEAAIERMSSQISMLKDLVDLYEHLVRHQDDLIQAWTKPAETTGDVISDVVVRDGSSTRNDGSDPTLAALEAAD
jgi:hypothetical protein